MTSHGGKPRKAKTTERKLNYEQGKHSKTYRRVCDAGYRNDRLRASTQSAPMELPGLPVGLAGLADAISPVGQIVGEFFASDFSVFQPVVWPRSNAAPIYLAELSETLRFGGAISINAVGNILGDGSDEDNVESHAVFWANSASAPVALASPGGEFIYTDVGLTGGVGAA